MRRIISLIVCIFLMLSVVAFAENATTELQGMYAEAELLMAQGDYSGAASKFEALGAYSDSSQMAMYCKAIAAAETLGMYDVAVMTFENLGDFRDSKQMVEYYKGRWNQASGDTYDLTILSSVSDHDLDDAVLYYRTAAGQYSNLALFKDCLTRASECQGKAEIIESEIKKRYEAKQDELYNRALSLENDEHYADAITAYKSIDHYEDYKDCLTRIKTCETAIDEKAQREEEAAEEATKETLYQAAIDFESKGDFKAAYVRFNKIEGYKDVDEHMANLAETGLLQDGCVLITEEVTYKDNSYWISKTTNNSYSETYALISSEIDERTSIGDRRTQITYTYSDDGVLLSSEAQEYNLSLKDHDPIVTTSDYIVREDGSIISCKEESFYNVEWYHFRTIAKLTKM